MPTKIGWTEETWNPVTGCSKVSPGCALCYAERLMKRWHRGPDGKFIDEPSLPWTPENAALNVVLHRDRLEKPLHWRKPRMIFVNSMSDLFHEHVPFEFVEQVWDTMFDTEKHTFQVLTKRPKRMLEFAQWMNDKRFRRIDYRNIWLGVSVENQYWADHRIPLLLETPAALWFVSAEPLLGPLNLRSWLYPGKIECVCAPPVPSTLDLPGMHSSACYVESPRLDWVIVGGESGPGARPMKVEWARSLYEQCRAAGIPFFMKQASGPRPGMQGDLPDDLWAVKELPHAKPGVEALPGLWRMLGDQ